MGGRGGASEIAGPRAEVEPPHPLAPPALAAASTSIPLNCAAKFGVSSVATRAVAALPLFVAMDASEVPCGGRSHRSGEVCGLGALLILADAIGAAI